MAITITERRRRSFHLTIALVVLNLILLNWIALERFERFDLTRDKVFTLHPETVKLVTELDDLLTLRVYMSERIFKDHEYYAFIPRQVHDWIDELATVAGGKVRVEFHDPSENEDAERAARMSGVRQVEISSQQSGSLQQMRVYAGLIASYGGKEQIIPWLYSHRLELKVEVELALAITRLAQRARTTIGFLQVRQLPEGVTPGQARAQGYTTDLNDIETGEFIALATELKKFYDVEKVPMWQEIPPHIDALVVANLEGLPDYGWFHVDQYLMGGGNVIILADGTTIDPNTQTPTADRGRNDPFFAHYGFLVHKDMVLDNQHRNYKPNVATRIPQLQPRFFAPDSILSGTPAFDLFFASSISLNPPPDVEATVLARSSPMSWRQQGFFTPLRDTPDAPTRAADYRQYDMVGMLRGEFRSFYANRALPEAITSGGLGPTWDDVMPEDEVDEEPPAGAGEGTPPAENAGSGSGASGPGGAGSAGASEGDGGPGGALQEPSRDSATADDGADDDVADDDVADDDDDPEEEDDVSDDSDSDDDGPGMARAFFVKEKSPPSATIVVFGNSRFLWNNFVSEGDLSGLQAFATVLDRMTTGGRLSAIRHRTAAAPSLRAELTAAERDMIKYAGILAMPVLTALFGAALLLLRRARRKRLAA